MTQDEQDKQDEPETPEERILRSLKAGARFRDAAHAEGKTTDEVRRMMSDNAEFDRNVRNAKATCKVAQLVRLSQAKGWQAPVFLLERKWPEEFGRRKPADAPAAAEKLDRTPRPVDLSFLPEEDQKRVIDAFRNAALGIEPCPHPLKGLSLIESTPPTKSD